MGFGGVGQLRHGRLPRQGGLRRVHPLQEHALKGHVARASRAQPRLSATRSSCCACSCADPGPSDNLTESRAETRVRKTGPAHVNDGPSERRGPSRNRAKSPPDAENSPKMARIHRNRKDSRLDSRKPNGKYLVDGRTKVPIDRSSPFDLPTSVNSRHPDGFPAPKPCPQRPAHRRPPAPAKRAGRDKPLRQPRFTPLGAPLASGRSQRRIRPGRAGASPGRTAGRAARGGLRRRKGPQTLSALRRCARDGPCARRRG